MKYYITLLCLMFVCTACSGTPSTKVDPAAALTPPPPAETLFERISKQAGRLPGPVVTSDIAGVIIAYPQESLFRRGSLLPLAGGAEMLDPLVSLLNAAPESLWTAKVRVVTGNGDDYDLSLAKKRSQLLQRYLRQGGIDTNRITWQERNGEGNDLELNFLPPQLPAGSSAGAKE